VYTAPPASGSTSDQLVSIAVTPVGSDFNNATARIVTIRLVPQGTLPPPSGLQPAFTFSPSSPLEHQLVFFDGRTSTGSTLSPITSYAWDFGDGGTASGSTATHTFTSPGTHLVRLTITNGLGASASITQTVNVGQSTAPTATFVFSPTNPEPNDTVFFNAEAATPAVGRRIQSYRWDFGDGSPIETRTTPTASHKYTQARTYTVTLVVTDDVGRTATASQTVVVEVPDDDGGN
jgi:PKD repeat protein